MKITPSGGQTGPGPADWFTGDVYIDTIRTRTTSRPSAAPTSASRPALAPRGTPPQGSDALRHRRHRARCARAAARPSGDPARRRGLHRAERGALARSHRPTASWLTSRCRKPTQTGQVVTWGSSTSPIRSTAQLASLDTARRAAFPQPEYRVPYQEASISWRAGSMATRERADAPVLTIASADGPFGGRDLPAGVVGRRGCRRARTAVAGSRPATSSSELFQPTFGVGVPAVEDTNEGVAGDRHRARPKRLCNESLQGVSRRSMTRWSTRRCRLTRTCAPRHRERGRSRKGY